MAIGADPPSIGADIAAIGTDPGSIGTDHNPIGTDPQVIGGDWAGARVKYAGPRADVMGRWADTTSFNRNRAGVVGTRECAGAPRPGISRLHSPAQTGANMGARDYMPTRDFDLEAWATNFSERITATPTAYGLTVADATALSNLVADYGTRLASATNPSTRTVVTITAKDISRSALKAKIRQLARIINADPDTTNPQREELGLCPRGRIVGPMPIPATRPNVSVDVLGGLQSGICLSDELTPTRRARPSCARGAYIWGKIDGPAPSGTQECQFLGTASRTRHVITHPPTAIHKTVWIVAQWVNDKGETGPISIPASTSVAA